MIYSLQACKEHKKVNGSIVVFDPTDLYYMDQNFKICYIWNDIRMSKRTNFHFQLEYLFK